MEIRRAPFGFIGDKTRLIFESGGRAFKVHAAVVGIDAKDTVG